MTDRKQKRPSTAQILAALPAAAWLLEVEANDVRARGFIPHMPAARDLAIVAGQIAQACGKYAAGREP